MISGRAWIVPVWIAFFIATNWPILKWANRIEPTIGPFPFLVFWMLICSLAAGALHLLFGLFCMGDPKTPEREPITDPVELPSSPAAAEGEVE